MGIAFGIDIYAVRTQNGGLFTHHVAVALAHRAAEIGVIIFIVVLFGGKMGISGGQGPRADQSGGLIQRPAVTGKGRSRGGQRTRLRNQVFGTDIPGSAIAGGKAAARIVRAGTGRTGVLLAGDGEVAAHGHVHILGCEIGPGHGGVLAGNGSQLFSGQHLGVDVSVAVAVRFVSGQIHIAVHSQRIALGPRSGLDAHPRAEAAAVAAASGGGFGGMNIQVPPGGQCHIPSGLGLGALHGQILPGGQGHIPAR